MDESRSTLSVRPCCVENADSVACEAFFSFEWDVGVDYALHLAADSVDVGMRYRAVEADQTPVPSP